MKTNRSLATIGFLLVSLMTPTKQISADPQRILVLKEIDDDHIIIVTEAGEQLLLEKWTLRFSPLVFEGKRFMADVSTLWVTIYFEDREAIKWSVEKSLGYLTPAPAALQSGTTPSGTPVPMRARGGECYTTTIQSPTPFLGNGGELIRLADGTVWKDVSYQYLYLYAYYPSVVICPSDGKLVLGRNVFQVISSSAKAP